jgi:acyl-CoA thioester hydrolase
MVNDILRHRESNEVPLYLGGKLGMLELTDFPVHVKISLAWGEMDAYGHINNINYLRYFETARIQYFLENRLIDLKSETGLGTILAQTTCKYHKPLTFPDQIVVGAKVKSMSKSSFVMEYLIVSEKVGVAASGEGVIVMYDYNASQKAELPLVIKAAIEEIEKGTLSHGVQLEQ